MELDTYVILNIHTDIYVLVLDKYTKQFYACNLTVYIHHLYIHIDLDDKYALMFSNQRKVVVHVTFIKIGEIDTLKELFEADVLIRTKWREPDLDKTKVCKNGVNLTKIKLRYVKRA